MRFAWKIRRGRAAGGAVLAALALAASPAVAQAPPDRGAPGAGTPEATYIVRTSPFIAPCGPRPQPGEFCRLPTPAFNAYDARDRLGGKDLTYWIKGDVLNVAARSATREAALTGTIDEDLFPLSRGLPYFGASYHAPGLDQAIIEMKLRGQAEDQALVYRGPYAPPVPAMDAPLKGRLQTIEVDSVALGAPRKVSVYTPPGPAPKGGWPAVIATDGDVIGPYVAILDALIERRMIRPVALVALWPRIDPNDRSARGASSHEYVRAADADSYSRHNMFFRHEVMPLVQARFGLTAQPSRRLLFGHGNGADWVLETAARDPDSAQSVAAFSPPGLSNPPFRPGKGHGLRVYMEAGAYEAPFLKGARVLCNLATASNAPCTLDEPYAGHEPLIWQAEFAKVMQKAFPVGRAR